MTEHNLESASASQRLIVQQRHAREKRLYAKAVGLLLLAVAAGAVIGVGATVLYFRGKMHRVPPKPSAIAEAMIGHMHETMGLQPGEEARLKEIIDKRMKEVEETRRSTFQTIREMFNKMDDEVGEVLGPERTKKWEDEKLKRFGKNRHSRKRYDGPRSERRDPERDRRDRRGGE